MTVLLDVSEKLSMDIELTESVTTFLNYLPVITTMTNNCRYYVFSRELSGGHLGMFVTKRPFPCNVGGIPTSARLLVERLVRIRAQRREFNRATEQPQAPAIR